MTVSTKTCSDCGVPREAGRSRCPACAYRHRLRRGGFRTCPCASCGGAMVASKGMSATPLCSACRTARREKWEVCGRECADCGRKTGSPNKVRCWRCANQSAGTVCCVHGCEKWAQAKGLCPTHYVYQWRQARGLIGGRGTWIEPKRRLAIYERDGWVCQICYLPIAVDAPVNDDYAPSLDHITPRSAGGGHETDNLRLAHRLCNAKRGAGKEVLDAA